MGWKEKGLGSAGMEKLSGKRGDLGVSAGLTKLSGKGKFDSVEMQRLR